VVSDRDVLRVVSPFLDTPAERDRDRYTVRRPVHQIMTRNPVTVDAEAGLDEAAARMLEAGVSCLPVVDGGRLVGVLTRKDLLGAIGRASGRKVS
jgi:acetoin utilization protein AcuB